MDQDINERFPPFDRFMTVSDRFYLKMALKRSGERLETFDSECNNVLKRIVENFHVHASKMKEPNFHQKRHSELKVQILRYFGLVKFCVFSLRDYFTETCLKFPKMYW